MSELFDRIDALVASRSPLPPPAERKRLRTAHGLTLDEVAQALEVRRATVSNWESLTKATEPRGKEREAYARMLTQLAELYPADANASTPIQDTAVPATLANAPDPAPEPAAATAEQDTPSRPATAPGAASRSAPAARPTSRRPAARNSAPAETPAGVDPRFANGPLAVIDVDDDGQVSAYCTGGLVLDVPAKSLPSLVDWTLREAKLGQPKLAGPGKDADPLIVLTEAALERYGLPATLTEEERLAGRLPEGHKVIKQLVRAGGS